MNTQEYVALWLCVFVLLLTLEKKNCAGMSQSERNELREKVKEMFHHGYDNYMKHAYPADELMPLSCKGRVRGRQRSRGDIDDALGNFSLTLIDTLDTLAVLGEVEEFERAVGLVLNDVQFDSDLVVSVFETNIRVLGGLLGAHTMAEYIRDKRLGMAWYEGELLSMAADVGYRLLPAFNTTTGIPYPRVNLRYGVKHEMSRTGDEKDTCTACAGTMILEFSALSRYTGDPIFEDKAHKAMEYLWRSRHRTSDLVGTVINIHNGDWVRRESGVGAGIDSYYEYLLKAYILLGDETYLERFNKHYAAIMRYINQGPLLMDVHMHRPMTNTRNFMDALLAFWPGLQVLKGDIKPAIEIHEMLYQVVQRHNFLPEAFTSDFRVHWGQHPLRPEFLESTYFIYQATGDPHYLDVGKAVLENLEKHARVPCGFAAIKDVTTGAHEDQLDSYVLAETFKYLYLLFSERDELILNVDEFVFTTEAHMLPLSISMQTPLNSTVQSGETVGVRYSESTQHERTCPNNHHMYRNSMNYAQDLRQPLKDMVNNLCPKSTSTSPAERRRKPRLRATEFMTGNKEQLDQLQRMGIRIITMSDGRIQLLHTSSEAGGAQDAEDGMVFMQEMIELSKAQSQEAQQEPRVVQLLSHPYLGNLVLNAGPAQFGIDLKTGEVEGKLAVADPYRACTPLENEERMRGNIVVMERGDCMFVDKARYAMAVGAIGGIVIDNAMESTVESAPLFAMSGDGKDDVTIPVVFLFHKEGQALLKAIEGSSQLKVLLTYRARSTEDVMKTLLLERDTGLSSAPPTPTETTPQYAPTSAHLMAILHTLQLNTLGFSPDAVWDAEMREKAIIGNIASAGNTHVSYIDGESNRELRLPEGSRQVADTLLDVVGRVTNINELSGRDDYVNAVRQIVKLMLDNKLDEVPRESREVVHLITSQLKLLETSPWPKAVDEVDQSPETTSESQPDSEDDDDDSLSQQINDVLDHYIVEQLTKVVNEVDLEVHDGSLSGEEATSAAHEEAASPPRQSLAEMIENMREDQKRQEEGRSNQGLVGKYLPPDVKQAPDWMTLGEGEVFVDKEGVVYANLAPEEFLDKTHKKTDSSGKIYYMVNLLEVTSSQESVSGDMVVSASGHYGDTDERNSLSGHQESKALHRDEAHLASSSRHVDAPASASHAAAVAGQESSNQGLEDTASHHTRTHKDEL